MQKLVGVYGRIIDADGYRGSEIAASTRWAPGQSTRRVVTKSLALNDRSDSAP